MAHNNPVTQSSSLSSTGSSNAPLGTNTSYTTTTQTDGPAADRNISTGGLDQRSTGQKVKDLINPDHRPAGESHTSSGAAAPGSTGRGSGIGAPFAAVHGVGEKIRGEFNAGVDRAFSERSGEVKNDAVAAEGEREMASGRFGAGTKERELGSGERRI